jgi:hypothetical protein
MQTSILASREAHEHSIAACLSLVQKGGRTYPAKNE